MTMIEWLLSFLVLLFWLIVLAAPVILIVLALLTLIGLHRRRRDRAIRLLDGFPVTLEREDGSRRSGVLRINTDGLTLEYALPATGHTPTVPITYLHYEAEWRALNAIYRFEDELSKQERERRRKQVDAVSDLWNQKRRWWRPGQWLDRLTERIIALWMHLRGRSFPEATFQTLPRTERKLLVGYAGDNVNAMLDENLGKQVVVRHFANNFLHRHQGMLIAYSRYFLFLAQTPISQHLQVRLRPEKGAGQEFTLRWRWKDGQLEIRNLCTYPLLLDHIRVGEKVRDLSMMIAAESTFTLHVDAPPRGETLLSARIIREADILLPRNRAIVRYAADLPGHLAALDVGVSLSPPDEGDAEEQRLRRELKQHPGDPAIAAALARHLYQKGKLNEAEQYYQQALAGARRLPDSGERVQLELTQLRMYREDEGELGS